ncbi:hypothetical protein TVAG_369350 [Trichomonas vaginalis G3]|uniref:Uncharacterized protein n=1 Tax=Trichomonas vaginalis (strain ATCC PRA-98 / G3) TaxID=412133 RepID=A2FGG1_TRIV3|nr:hypothetical protein TVAGG3_0435980 [Trichomonas vaginalis G3]EAX96025.1 hypothetical protein TVAG_369350 [Trichomonas vaginalis G3]KAI5537096.1 hypothetical protein TVAGG3_0435980 [Trichomonas vaginalis G3]|eukprot:XP_001308955.1 hypothetical protein [Trichomonas vaginalis G3]
MENRNSLSNFPSPSQFNTYEDYIRAVRKWKRAIQEIPPNKVQEDLPTAFLRSPKFDHKYPKKSDNPPFEKKVDLLETILIPSKNSRLTEEETKNWIFPNGIWTGVRLDSFPIPEFYPSEDLFDKDAIIWAENTEKEVHTKATEFNSFGYTVSRPSFTVGYKQNKDKTLIFTDQELFTPKSIGDAISTPVFETNYAPATRKQQKHPELDPNSFYAKVLKKNLIPCESTSHIQALKSAYLSMPYFTGNLRTPPQLQNLFHYPLETQFIGPRSFIQKINSSGLISSKQFQYYLTKNPNTYSVEMRTELRDFFFFQFETQRFDILNKLYNQYIFLLCLTDILVQPVNIDYPAFEAAEKTPVKLLSRAHSVFAHVSLSRALVKIALTIKYKPLTNYLKSAVKEADSALSSFFNQNSKTLISIINNSFDEHSFQISVFLFLVADSLQTNQCKNFINGLSIRFLSKLFKKAPHLKNNVIYRICSRKQICSLLFDRLFFDFETNIEYVKKMARFFTNLCYCGGDILPSNFYKKCDGLIILISNLCAHIKTNCDFEYVLLTNKLVKLVMRYRKLNYTANSDHWTKFIKNSSSLLLSMLENLLSIPNSKKFTHLTVDAVASLASDPRYGEFFCDEKNSYFIMSLLSSSDNYIVHCAYKILCRFLLNDDKSFAKIFFVEGDFHRHLVNSIKIVDIPCYIDIIKIVYKSALKFVDPDPIDDKSSQMGFLFSIATVPRQYLNLIQIIDAAEFNITNSVKVLAANKKDPVIARRFHHIHNLRKVLRVRSSASKLAFKIKA